MSSRPSESLPAYFAELGAWASSRGIAATTHAYGAHPDQHAELRLPPGDGPHPVAVVVHGGFWRSMYTKDNTRAVATALAQAGWATWNIEYRRVGSGGGYPATFEDVAAACAAVRALDAPLDPDHLISIGHSAGGHIALWSAAERLVAGAVSLAGVCDLAAAHADRLDGDAAAAFMGAPPEQAPTEWARADPMSRLPTGVPTLLVHGTQDDRVPINHSRAYRRAAHVAGDDCRLLELDCDHFDVMDPRSAVWPEIERAVGALLS